MKKQLLIIIIAIMSSIYTFGQSALDFSQVNQTLTNSHLIISLDTSDNIRIKIKPSTDEYLKIDVQIKSPVSKKGVIEFLKKSGRYQLKTYEHSDLYSSVLTKKYKQNLIYVNGAYHKETVIYTLHIPPHIKYKVKLPQQKDNELASR